MKSQQAQMFGQAQEGDTVIVLEVSRLARSTQQLCEIIDTIREKRLRLVIVGSITLDCGRGQADPMSEAFLQMAGGIQSAGIGHDSGESAVRDGKCQSQGAAHRAAANDCGSHSRYFPPPLSGVQE